MASYYATTIQRDDRPFSGDFDLWSAGHDKQAIAAYLVAEPVAFIEVTHQSHAAEAAMRIITLSIGLISLCCGLVSAGLASASPLTTAPDALVTAAERYRGLAESYVLNGRIETRQNGVQDKVQPYQLLAGTDRKSLVIFTGGINQGQKVLLQDQQFWLQLPGSRRPMRITPMQKLMGEASSGDVASLSWSADYQATLASEQPNADEQVLELSANRAGLSYQRIRLVIAASDQFPLRAEFYVGSGKLAKQATFVRGPLNGQDRVIAMQLTDKLQSKAITVLHYDSVTPQQLPARLFNPQAMTTVQAL